jgi:hypothetical protein
VGFVSLGSRWSFDSDESDCSVHESGANIHNADEINWELNWES